MQDWDNDESTGLEEVSVPVTLPRNDSGLTQLSSVIGEALDTLGASGRSRYRVELVAEEILTNLVKYGGAGGGEQVEMTLTQGPTELRLEVSDRTPPYSPESSEPAKLGENPVRDGGLGLSLVRRSCDQLFYDTDEDGMNTLIAVFRRDAGEEELDKAGPMDPEDGIA